MSARRTFRAVVTAGPRDTALVSLPFDPDAVWGRKAVHHVAGMVGPCRVRGPLIEHDGGYALKLGPAWLRDGSVKAGDAVDVALSPEGPQRESLDPDIAEALAAEPQAAAFFDGLAQFYRNSYLKWIAATKRKPEERARRIAETVRLLKAGVKERSRQP